MNFKFTPHLRISLVGFVANLGLAALKIFAGIIGNSRAVMADGIHSLSDLTTDLGAVFCSFYCTEPADHEHPYGHGRMDLLISLGIALFMAAAGIGLLLSSLNDLRTGSTGTPPGLIALAAAAVSLVGKEILYQWTIRRSRSLKSPSLEANAKHHRSDALSSAPVLLAVLIARIFPSWHFLDSVAGITVSAWIIKMSWDIGAKAVRQLSDASASDEVIAEIERLLNAHEEVKEVHRIRTRSIGNGLSVDLHLLIDGSTPVRKGHEIAGWAKHTLLENGPDIVDVVVHIEPADDQVDLKKQSET